VTILMDNVTDPLIPDHGPITRISRPKALAQDAPHVAAPLTTDGAVPDALIAEPGFSALVRVEKGEREHTLLFDTGVSPTGMVENMRRLGLSPRDVEVIVLSHGHWDHVTGMEGLANAIGRANLPVLIHPEFRSRRAGSDFQGSIRRSFRRPVAWRWRAPASRSSRSAGRPSCSTARC
jgi:7,8-dihydropterin-6-yl-methyl-4-(beta-D-ribofuranosyl)aminobenzene 5'-phosphate synthase